MGVSTNMKEWQKRAEHHLENAERQIMSHVVPNAPNIKFEDATLAYQRAAEAFRICEKWQEACDAYAKAADIQVRLGCPEEAASYASEAAETMVKVNPADAITFYRNAISLLCEVGKFGTAGRIQRKLAEWYEEDRNFDEAIDQYRQASDYYLGDNMIEQSDLCLLKCAYYQGLMEEFEDAGEIYANVGLRCLDNNLLKFNARKHFLRCGLLHLAGGQHMHGKVSKSREAMTPFGEFSNSMLLTAKGSPARLQDWGRLLCVQQRVSLLGEHDGDECQVRRAYKSRRTSYMTVLRSNHLHEQYTQLLNHF